jgi:diaminopimelate epimerase
LRPNILSIKHPLHDNHKMTLEFTKMNGAGNDFVMIDNRDGSINLDREQIASLCDRHRGIGADGLIAVEGTPELPRMRYYNADGGEAEMCGNGARCFSRFTARLLGQTSGSLSFKTEAGILSAELLPDDRVRLRMSEPHSLQLAHSLRVLDSDLEVHSLNTGVPHAVTFVQKLEETPVFELGRALRQHQRFAPAGSNANFAQILNPVSLSIRTYERGVENETLACGTGVVASALIHHHLTKAPSPISVQVRGGDTLEVGFKLENGHPADVTLAGPADFVFTGTMTI